MYEEKFCSDESFRHRVCLEFYSYDVVDSFVVLCLRCVRIYKLCLCVCLCVSVSVCTLNSLTFPSNFILESLSCCSNKKTETKCFRAFKRFSDFNFVHEHLQPSFVHFFLKKHFKVFTKDFLFIQSNTK